MTDYLDSIDALLAEHARYTRQPNRDGSDRDQHLEPLDAHGRSPIRCPAGSAHRDQLHRPIQSGTRRGPTRRPGTARRSASAAPPRQLARAPRPTDHLGDHLVCAQAPATSRAPGRIPRARLRTAPRTGPRPRARTVTSPTTCTGSLLTQPPPSMPRAEPVGLRRPRSVVPAWCSANYAHGRRRPRSPAITGFASLWPPPTVCADYANPRPA